MVSASLISSRSTSNVSGHAPSNRIVNARTASSPLSRTASIISVTAAVTRLSTSPLRARSVSSSARSALPSALTILIMRRPPRPSTVQSLK